MKRGRAVSDSGDRIGGIISLNLENCENPLWIWCDSTRARARERAGQLTTGKLDFACAKDETEIELQGIKVSGATETVSVLECSRRNGGDRERVNSSYRALAFVWLDRVTCRLKHRAVQMRQSILNAFF